MKRSWVKYALWTVPLILGLGMASGWLSGSGFGNPWFDALVKPGFMPPGWAFGTAWTILYVLLGVAAALVLALPPSAERKAALAIFWVQMALNFTWSPIFFAAHDIALAKIVLFVILLMAAIAAGKFWRLRPLAGGLMIPYLGWLIFASVLNSSILELNPRAGASLLTLGG